MLNLSSSRTVLDTTDVVLGANYPFIANGDDILTDVGAYTQAEGVTIYFRLAGELPLSFSLCAAR